MVEGGRLSGADDKAVLCADEAVLDHVRETVEDEGDARRGLEAQVDDPGERLALRVRDLPGQQRDADGERTSRSLKPGTVSKLRRT